MPLLRSASLLIATHVAFVRSLGGFLSGKPHSRMDLQHRHNSTPQIRNAEIAAGHFPMRTKLDDDGSFSLPTGGFLQEGNQQLSVSGTGSAAAALLRDGKKRGDDLTMCTLVDGRGVSLSSRVDVSVKHLVLTSHADHAVVLVDCRDGDVPAKLWNDLQDLGISFDYECVNTTDAARSEWAHMWVADPDLALGQWPEGSYKSVLRMGLHQCLSKNCKTRFCAWADSDLLMIPNHHEGWARGMRDCLSCSGPDDAAVFAVLPWFDMGYEDWAMLPCERDAPNEQNQCQHTQFEEFSSQAFVVDRSRLFDAWLPVPSDQATRWFMSLSGRDSNPLQGSAIEGLVVAKSFSDHEQCKVGVPECLPVKMCVANDGVQTLKLHTGDFVNIDSMAAALAANLTQLDAELVRTHQKQENDQSHSCSAEIVELREHLKMQLQSLYF